MVVSDPGVSHQVQRVAGSADERVDDLSSRVEALSGKVEAAEGQGWGGGSEVSDHSPSQKLLPGKSDGWDTMSHPSLLIPSPRGAPCKIDFSSVELEY